MPVAQSRTRRIETSAGICDKDRMLWQKLFSTLALSAAFTFFGATGNAATCCVWRMTNAPAPFYLVGTIHALSSHDYPLPAGYNQALHDSKRLVFEMKPDPRSDFSNTQPCRGLPAGRRYPASHSSQNLANSCRQF